MQVQYDQIADAVYFRLRGEKVSESVEMSEGVIVDYDSKGISAGLRY